MRFPKEYLDRLDVLTIDGRVLDAAAWNVQRLIWRPDLRLDKQDVDAGSRSGNLYLGPGWSLERRERTSGSGEMTFVQPLTNRAIISASLPTRAVELVLRASSPADAGPRSLRVQVDGRPSGQPNCPARMATAISPFRFRRIRRARPSVKSLSTSRAAAATVPYSSWTG